MTVGRLGRIRLSLLTQFTLLGILLTAIIAAGVGALLSRQIEQRTLDQASWNGYEQAQVLVEPLLLPADFNGSLSPERYQQLDRALRPLLSRHQIVRVKLWDQHHKLLYHSDLPQLVGQTFSTDEDLDEALAGRVVSDISRLDKPEQAQERGAYSELLEVHAPVRLAGSDQVMGAYEFYSDPAPLWQQISDAQHSVWGAVAAGFGVLFIGLFGFVRRASRRLEAAMVARERLEEQLRQAQKMEAVGRLAGGIAHDFNNLLTVITGYSELILTRPHDTSLLSARVAAIQAAGEKAATLTQQLLAFSRRQVRQPRVLNLNAVVTGMGDMLKRLIGEDIDLVSQLDPALTPVEADPSQLEQVLLNLVVNARDAMPQGGRLTLGTANVLLDDAYAQTQIGVKPGRYVLLAASDTGGGMDSETRLHVFEPFFTTKEPGKGTGLGLSTVYGIVKQGGGHVTVDSAPGRGTTFFVYLPSVDVPIALPAPATEPHQTPLGRETVLLVEDEDGVRALARSILQLSGCRVIEAAGAVEALAQAAGYDGPIDLLLTDVVMPEISGRQLAERLVAERPTLKVLYMSGYTDEAMDQHGVLGSGVAFIQKPFTMSALSQKLREVVDGGAVLDAAGSRTRG